MACGCVNSRIFFSDCGSLLRPAKDPRKIFSRRGLAAPCGGRGNCPPKAVSEPPASVKCKPFHFVSTRKYPLFSMYHDPGIHPKIYLPFECTSFQPSAHPSALDVVRRIGIVLSQSALPWKMARRFCHLQSVTIDVSCDIVLSSKTSFLSPAIQR